jgi:TolA-binding protein
MSVDLNDREVLGAELTTEAKRLAEMQREIDGLSGAHEQRVREFRDVAERLKATNAEIDELEARRSGHHAVKVVTLARSADDRDVTEPKNVVMLARSADDRDVGRFVDERHVLEVVTLARSAGAARNDDRSILLLSMPSRAD